MISEWSYYLTIIMATLLMVISVLHLMSAVLTARRVDIALAGIETGIDFLLFHGIYDSFSYGRPVSITGRFIETLERGSFMLFLLFLLMLIMSILRLRNLHHTIWTSITSFSVGEALDKIPVGVMFFLEDGEVLQSNATMEELFYEWTGKPLFYANALWDGSVPGEKIVQQGEAQILSSEDGRRWQMSRREAELAYGKPVYEVVVTDVTREDSLLHQLNKQIGQLEKLNRHLREYNDVVDEVVRKEELLEAKRQVHGNMGSDLLSARMLLSGGKSPVNAADVLEQWRRNVHLLREEAGKEKRADSSLRLKEAAAFLGIDLQMAGDMPEDPAAAELISIAVGECLTNAMQHAQADQVYVVIKQDIAETKVWISNNGKPVEQPLREGGGLSMLRRSAENAGASVSYLSDGCFRMEMRIPRRYTGGEK